MTEVEPVLDFASSGRSGRRNALPDILGSPAGVNPGDLPLKLAELSLKGTANFHPVSSVVFLVPISFTYLKINMRLSWLKMPGKEACLESRRFVDESYSVSAMA